MAISGWYFRLRDSGVFTIISAAGYLFLGFGALVFAVLSGSTFVSVLSFLSGTVLGGIGILIIWNAGRVQTHEDFKPKK